MYPNGYGMPKDDVQAYKWLAPAAARGHAVDRNHLNNMIGGIAPEELAEGRRLVAEWRPR